MQARVDITYPPMRIRLRYFEALGKVTASHFDHQATWHRHESTIREYKIGANGMTIGEPLETFQGVLRGVPTYLGASNPLLGDEIP